MIYGAQERPAPTMADIPFIRAFAVRHPSAGTESVRKFYERLEELEQKSTTGKYASANGIKLDPSERLSKAEAAKLKQLRRINRKMSDLRKRIRTIYASKLSPESKRQRIDALETQIVRLARTAIRIRRAA